MAERPIIFSTLMVQAILAGKKTQTRRVIDKDIVYDISPQKAHVFRRGMNAD